MKLNEIEACRTGAGLVVAVVQSRFNEEIGDGLRSGCLDELERLGVPEVTYATVPGALELPLALQALAQSGRYHALIALGAVIRGETYHFEIVANESARGMGEVQLKTGVPVANAVLTTENDDQALERMVQKGREAALAAVEMANLLRACA
ncbi:MAG: 6,7-dimethyl-8-ribityllumazine synthase [Betaproteobacteria bacterium HGW-Betaproteobacteria-11]|nr:MAG: 6,7-dimethyl-8-ribityllumazine synthase [Betaproteobacteria bacterium HGW-Betaproteobacteria-11]